MFTRGISKIITGIGMAILLLVTVGWLWHERSRPISVPILMYHRIGNDYDSPWWVTTRDFETQLEGLKEQGYASVWPSDLVAHQRWGWPLPHKPILLTFDDGYRNVMEQVEPLLKKYGFTGVSYLISGRVGDAPDTRQVWEGTPLLIWPEVKEVYRRGTIRFGGHSRSHPNLRAMADPRQEMASCYRDIQRKGGFTPEGFCFPFGQYKAETLAELARTKFTTATTCEDGIAQLKPGNSLFELPRVSVVGGLHLFHLHSVTGGVGQVQFVVSKEGKALDVTPKLILESGAPQWLAPAHVTSAPTVLFTLPAGSRSNPATSLELWDNMKVFRIFRSPL